MALAAWRGEGGVPRAASGRGDRPGASGHSQRSPSTKPAPSIPPNRMSRSCAESRIMLAPQRPSRKYGFEGGNAVHAGGPSRSSAQRSGSSLEDRPAKTMSRLRTGSRTTVLHPRASGISPDGVMDDHVGVPENESAKTSL